MRLIVSSILFLFLVAFTSCNEQPKAIKKKSTKIVSDSIIENEHNEKVEKSSLKLDNFGFPDDIEGCSCYFSKSKKMFENNEYFFMANYDSLVHIMVNSELINLKLEMSTREPNSFGDYDHKEIYKNDMYTVTINIVYKESSGDETWLNEETIIVDAKDGQHFKHSIFGECGC
jgi:hypothetical protein